VARKSTISTPKKAITQNRDWREPFLLALASSGNISHACSEAGIDRKTAYNRKRDDAGFRARWSDAINEAADLLELEARRRAHDGVNEPVVFQGEVAGQWVDEGGETCQKGTPGARFVPLTIKRYSDTLLIFLMKGTRPKKWRESFKHEFTGRVRHTHRHKSVIARLRGNPEAFDAAMALTRQLRDGTEN
jgi:hypothetical protein